MCLFSAMFTLPVAAIGGGYKCLSRLAVVRSLLIDAKAFLTHYYIYSRRRALVSSSPPTALPCRAVLARHVPSCVFFQNNID